MRPLAPRWILSLPLAAFLAALPAAIFASPAAADTPANAAAPGAAPAAEFFFERVDVDVINVEAYVTDKKGNPVGGLAAADFEILEDGQPVPITNFFRNENVALTGGGPFLGAEPAAQPSAEPSAKPAGVPQEPPAGALPTAEEPPAGQRMNLLVYVDLYNLRPPNKARVLKHLEGFLQERIAKGDHVMTVAHDRNVVLIHPFTRDAAEVAAGVRKLGRMATNGQVTEAERRRVFRSMSWSTGDAAVDRKTAFDNIRTFVRQQSMETEFSMAALGMVLRSLGGLPGRRALLYVSDGIEQQPASDLFTIFREIYSRNDPSSNRAEEQPELERARGDLGRLFRAVAAAANTYQITLYTLQAHGSSGDSDITGIDAQAARAQSEQEPLLFLADRTGGSAIINTVNFGEMLGRLSSDFDNGYSLGYRTRGGGDGKYHKIEVKVKRPGLEVRHRRGYLDAPESERAADRAFSALFLGSENNPLGITVDFATPQDGGLAKYLLPLLLRIPLRQVTLLPDGDKQRGKLRLFFAVQDQGGAISQVQEIPYPVEIPAAEAGQLEDKEIGFALKLAVRPGNPKISVTVWDEVSGIESNLLRSVQVGGEAPRKAAGR